MRTGISLCQGVARWVEDRAPFGLFTTDRRLLVTGWNGWLASHSGRTRREVMGWISILRGPSRAALVEKEVLLKEIHHRVKNNLQIISSLLRLKTEFSGDERIETVFRESQDRIRAMAAVHSMLYKSKNFTEINFGEYIRETARQLFRSYNTNPEKISLIINADDVMIPINNAIPCGLIVNELISNALKYAFPDGGRGEIRVEMNRDEN